jgi:nicotinamidase-related amidase
MYDSISVVYFSTNEKGPKMSENTLQFQYRRQTLIQDNGYSRWKTVEEEVFLSSAAAAVIVVDMWDRHWCSGATARGGVLAGRINSFVKSAREKGVLIVHAPSETMDFYAGQPARERFLAGTGAAPVPGRITVADHPMPIDASDGGSDTPELDKYPPNTRVWTRQTETIEIDQSADLVCGDEGEALFPHLRARGIRNVIFTGVHTNMCILHRSFGIKNMLRQGFSPVLVRDLTDAMYNPAKPPYVSHEDGTRLVVEYIEKFYCPTVGA